MEVRAPTPAIDIRPDHWQIVRHTLRRYVPQYAVWAFGSRAKWTAKPHSDLDLAVITDKPLPLSISAALADDFLESNLPWKVDVVDWAATSESFRKVIERDKVVVQESGTLGDRRETTLGDICQQQGGTIQTGPFGSQLHASDYTATGTPVVMPVNLIDGNISEQDIARISGEMVEKLARHKLKPGDIVFSRRGDVTRFALVSERETGWLCGTGCLKVSVGKPMLATPEFIAATLASPESKEWLVRHAVGATMPNLNTGILGGIPVTLPPLEEQRAIAETLGALDNRIDNLRQTNATLQAIAAALFKSWFVDFDGVPPEDMQESELGLIPKGWRVASLEEHVDAERGLSYKGAGLAEAGAGVPMHNLNSVLEFGGYKYTGIKYYSGDCKEKHLAVAGDIIVANTEQGHEHRLIGFPAIVPGSYTSGLFSHHLYRVRIKADSPVMREWLYHCLMAPSVREQIIGCANGSTVNMLKPAGLKIPRFALPPHELCETFDAIAAPLRLKAEANVEQMETLAALRDTLLPRLISGQLRVPDAGRLVAETA